MTHSLIGALVHGSPLCGKVGHGWSGRGSRGGCRSSGNRGTSGHSIAGSTVRNGTSLGRPFGDRVALGRTAADRSRSGGGRSRRSIRGAAARGVSIGTSTGRPFGWGVVVQFGRAHLGSLGSKGRCSGHAGSDDGGGELHVSSASVQINAI